MGRLGSTIGRPELLDLYEGFYGRLTSTPAVSNA